MGGAAAHLSLVARLAQVDGLCLGLAQLRDDRYTGAQQALAPRPHAVQRARGPPSHRRGPCSVLERNELARLPNGRRSRLLRAGAHLWATWDAAVAQGRRQRAGDSAFCSPV